MSKKNCDICQSCGMPLKDATDFGTKYNGTKSEEYCHFCFQDGEFVDAHLTLDEQIERLTVMAVEKMKMSEKKAKEIAETTLPKLKRWNIKEEW